MITPVEHGQHLARRPRLGERVHPDHCRAVELHRGDVPGGEEHAALLAGGGEHPADAGDVHRAGDLAIVDDAGQRHPAARLGAEREGDAVRAAGRLGDLHLARAVGAGGERLAALVSVGDAEGAGRTERVGRSPRDADVVDVRVGVRRVPDGHLGGTLRGDAGEVGVAERSAGRHAGPQLPGRLHGQIAVRPARPLHLRRPSVVLLHQVPVRPGERARSERRSARIGGVLPHRREGAQGHVQVPAVILGERAQLGEGGVDLGARLPLRAAAALRTRAEVRLEAARGEAGRQADGEVGAADLTLHPADEILPVRAAGSERARGGGVLRRGGSGASAGERLGPRDEERRPVLGARLAQLPRHGDQRGLVERDRLGGARAGSRTCCSAGVGLLAPRLAHQRPHRQLRRGLHRDSVLRPAGEGDPRDAGPLLPLTVERLHAHLGARVDAGDLPPLAPHQQAGLVDAFGHPHVEPRRPAIELEIRRALDHLRRAQVPEVPGAGQRLARLGAAGDRVHVASAGIDATELRLRSAHDDAPARAALRRLGGQLLAVDVEDHRRPAVAGGLGEELEDVGAPVRARRQRDGARGDLRPHPFAGAARGVAGVAEHRAPARLGAVAPGDRPVRAADDGPGPGAAQPLVIVAVGRGLQLGEGARVSARGGQLEAEAGIVRTPAGELAQQGAHLAGAAASDVGVRRVLGERLVVAPLGGVGERAENGGAGAAALLRVLQLRRLALDPGEPVLEVGHRARAHRRDAQGSPLRLQPVDVTPRRNLHHRAAERDRVGGVVDRLVLVVAVDLPGDGGGALGAQPRPFVHRQPRGLVGAGAQTARPHVHQRGPLGHQRRRLAWHQLVGRPVVLDDLRRPGDLQRVVKEVGEAVHRPERAHHPQPHHTQQPARRLRGCLVILGGRDRRRERAPERVEGVEVHSLGRRDSRKRSAQRRVGPGEDVFLEREPGVPGIAGRAGVHPRRRSGGDEHVVRERRRTEEDEAGSGRIRARRGPHLGVRAGAGLQLADGDRPVRLEADELPGHHGEAVDRLAGGAGDSGGRRRGPHHARAQRVGGRLVDVDVLRRAPAREPGESQEPEHRHEDARDVDQAARPREHAGRHAGRERDALLHGAPRAAASARRKRPR